MLALVATIFLLCHPPARADELPNPFAEIEALDSVADHGDPAAVERLMQAARRLTLYGTARGYARELLKLAPNHELARSLLWYRKFTDTASGKPVWLDWFDAGMWGTYHKVRNETLGYCLLEDREAIEQGKVRTPEGRLEPVDDWDRSHSQWPNYQTVYSRYFVIKSTIPVAAIWYIADDLDYLVMAYLDYFEIEHLPASRFTAQLYRTREDADAAGADGALLTTYGAYYSPPQGVLHLIFDSLGSLTAVRHEAAHALNRACADPDPAQWFDEGIGVLCQFAIPQADHSFRFGLYPDHGFGTTFPAEVRAGAPEQLVNIHAVSYVTTNSHYYSKFRAMVDFFMNAAGKKYRMAFIQTMFRRQRDVTWLLTRPKIDTQWTIYVISLDVDPDWHSRPPSDARGERIRQVLDAGTSAVAIKKNGP